MNVFIYEIRSAMTAWFDLCACIMHASIKVLSLASQVKSSSRIDNLQLHACYQVSQPQPLGFYFLILKDSPSQSEIVR